MEEGIPPVQGFSPCLPHDALAYIFRLLDRRELLDASVLIPAMNIGLSFTTVVTDTDGCWLEHDR